MSIVRRLRLAAGLTQAELARRAGTSQPTIAAYETGTKMPNWRTVQRLAHATGHTAAVEFVPELTREDRRSLALHRAIAAKLLESTSEVLAIARRNLQRALDLHPNAAGLLTEWRAILRAHPETIAAVMTHPGSRARELRQVTPFAGVLTHSERVEVYTAFRRREAAA